MLQNNNKSIICVGGTDPSGGAGLAADSRTCTALHTLCRPVVTTITAQTHGRFSGDWPVADEVVLAQLDAALSLAPDAPVKIGAIGARRFASLGQQLAARLEDRFVIVDPVLGASSGGRLAPPSHEIIRHLLPLASLLTPNLDELSELATSDTDREYSPIAAARQLIKGKTVAVLVKGGHGTNPSLVEDVLVYQERHRTFTHPRSTKTARGTGCVLASAICCAVAGGLTLAESIERATAFVSTCFEGDRGVLVFTDNS